MTDNRWQIGIAGNYTNEDDEKVRKAILDAQKKIGGSGSEAAKWLILRATANALLREAEPMRELTANAPADFTPVIEAMHNEFSKLIGEVGKMSEKLDNITVTHIPPRQELPPTMDETPTTWEEIDPNADTPFLKGVKTMGARPGRRLES